MPEITQLLDAIESGRAGAAEELFPLVYDELRRLAAARLNCEEAGQTLDATALVHEAYLRLLGGQQFSNRRHFLSAAMEAMRRILIEQARRKKRIRHGGGRRRVPFDQIDLSTDDRASDFLDVDEALQQLTAIDPRRAEVVRLKLFAGLPMPEIAEVTGLSLATVERYWTFARTWLQARLQEKPVNSAEA